VADGDWQPLTQKDVAASLTGNTVEEFTGKWAVHYASDEREAVWVSKGEARIRKWFVNDQGEWCETLYWNEALRRGPSCSSMARKDASPGA